MKPGGLNPFSKAFIYTVLIFKLEKGKISTNDVNLRQFT
jgi:hypothetical protein